MVEKDDLVRLVHGTPTLICLAVAGAGVRALAWLFEQPGASRTILDAQAPYSMRALEEYAGAAAKQHVSAVEARRMAEAALERARRLAGQESQVAGVACTAAVVTDRPRRGANRCHVAWTKDGGGAAYSLQLNKGERDRNGEEEVVSRLLLNAVAEACGLDERVDMPLLTGEAITSSVDCPSAARDSSPSQDA